MASDSQRKMLDPSFCFAPMSGRQEQGPPHRFHMICVFYTYAFLRKRVNPTRALKHKLSNTRKMLDSPSVGSDGCSKKNRRCALKCKNGRQGTEKRKKSKATSVSWMRDGYVARAEKRATSEARSEPARATYPSLIQLTGGLCLSIIIHSNEQSFM